MTADNSPAVPVSGHAGPGERAALPWTAERQANAEPTLVPEVDAAAVLAASGRSRSGRDLGPQAAVAAVVLAADETAPIGGQMAPGNDKAGDYWTPERLRSAKPMPKPLLPPGALGKGPGQNNR